MKKYKTKLKHDFAEALLLILDDVFERIVPGDDEDQLWLAALAETKLCLQKKMVMYSREYSITFTPVQAISLRLVYVYFFQFIHNEYTANRLLQIANEINQLYTQPKPSNNGNNHFQHSSNLSVVPHHHVSV